MPRGENGHHLLEVQPVIIAPMCGIVGYIGSKNVFPPLLNWTETALNTAMTLLVLPFTGRELRIYKKESVSDLEDYCADKDVTGTGIGHTRWAGAWRTQ